MISSPINNLLAPCPARSIQPKRSIHRLIGEVTCACWCDWWSSATGWFLDFSSLGGKKKNHWKQQTIKHPGQIFYKNSGKQKLEWFGHWGGGGDFPYFSPQFGVTSAEVCCTLPRSMCIMSFFPSSYPVFGVELIGVNRISIVRNVLHGIFITSSTVCDVSWKVSRNVLKSNAQRNNVLFRTFDWGPTPEKTIQIDGSFFSLTDYYSIFIYAHFVQRQT